MIENAFSLAMAAIGRLTFYAVVIYAIVLLIGARKKE